MSSEVKKKRIFLGIPVSEDVREKVREIQKELPREGFKPVKPENLHLTLKFVGWVKEDKLKEIKKSLGNLDWGKKFKVNVCKTGAFPTENQARVIWFGLEDGEKMFELHKKIDSGLSQMFEMEKRFTAHVTLSRVKLIEDKEKLKKFLEKFKDVELGEMMVDKVVLYQSVLRRAGPEYSVIEEYGLS